MTHMKLEQNYKCKNVPNTSKIKTYWNVESGAVLRTKAMHKALILVSSEKLKHLHTGPAETTHYIRRNHVK